LEVSLQPSDESPDDRNAPTCGRRRRVRSRFRIEIAKRAQHVALHRRDRDAIAIDDAGRGGSAEVLVAADDAGEVQWIGAADADEPIVGAVRRTSRSCFNGIGQRELFSRLLRDEPSAANIAPRLEAADKRARARARHVERLARQQAAEHDAVAAQQRPGERLYRSVVSELESVRIGGSQTSGRRRPGE
jgi:hypothetical protein